MCNNKNEHQRRWRVKLFLTSMYKLQLLPSAYSLAVRAKLWLVVLHVLRVLLAYDEGNFQGPFQ